MFFFFDWEEGVWGREEEEAVKRVARPAGAESSPSLSASAQCCSSDSSVVFTFALFFLSSCACTRGHHHCCSGLSDTGPWVSGSLGLWSSLAAVYLSSSLFHQTARSLMRKGTATICMNLCCWVLTHSKVGVSLDIRRRSQTRSCMPGYFR